MAPKIECFSTPLNINFTSENLKREPFPLLFAPHQLTTSGFTSSLTLLPQTDAQALNRQFSLFKTPSFQTHRSSTLPLGLNIQHIPSIVGPGGQSFLCFVTPESISEMNGLPPIPEARRENHIDTYHETKTVADPYRWLEKGVGDPEVDAFVKAHSLRTEAYFSKIPYRMEARDRLRELIDYPRYGSPFGYSNSLSKKNGWYYYTHNTGLQNHFVYYREKWDHTAQQVILDPNKLSEDGTIQVKTFDISEGGKFLVYGTSKGGADFEDLHVKNLLTGEELAGDEIKGIKFPSTEWKGDTGFYYAKPDDLQAGKELTQANKNRRIYYHQVGTSRSEDKLVYWDKANPDRWPHISVTEDQKYEILSLTERSKGKKGNSLFVRNIAKGETEFKAIVPEIGDDTYGVIDNVGDKFLISTNKDAPNRKIIEINLKNIDPKNSEKVLKNAKEILPHNPTEPLASINTAGGKIFATYLQDVKHVVRVYNLNGKFEREIKLPGIGTVSGFGGKRDNKFVFYTFNSFNYPPAIFKYDITTGKSSLYRSSEIKNFNPDDYEVKQFFCQNKKDGTRVPIYVVHKKGIKLDGTNPTLLYGYGGFKVNQMPSFSSFHLSLLEQGVVYVSANLRGGLEYGENWYKQGTKLQKQNVFDDFITVAEWLMDKDHPYTSPEKLAISGGSNGGLLVGAVTNQRPDLFRVAIPRVGVMDMLRYHKFTSGDIWKADYGTSDDPKHPEEFDALYAYSPYHNVRAGVKYPAVLVMTGDHDDRVVPGHSFKYGANLMATVTDSKGPLLLRINTTAGHGGVNLEKSIMETGDYNVFLFNELGITPQYSKK